MGMKGAEYLAAVMARAVLQILYLGGSKGSLNETKQRMSARCVTTWLCINLHVFEMRGLIKEFFRDRGISEWRDDHPTA
jgi:UDP-N-acetyl-D-mannosaminuronic acid transferase (WecB/TagA/CpsF family)